MSDPIRKAVESIFYRLEVPLRNCAPNLDLDPERDAAEDLIRSTFPALSQALGELAVARQRLDELADLADESYSDAGREASKRRWASDSDSGKLAAELIRAAVQLAPLISLLYGSDRNLNGDEAKNLIQREKSLVPKADALLQAFPGLREEVERG